MIEELKDQLERTFHRKILDRGDCEALAQDIYEKVGIVISYNTLRRLFGLAEYRKLRESTLDVLGQYIGYKSYRDFTHRFSEIDTWPNWEHLYVVLSENNPEIILDFLKFRKRQQLQFTMAFTIVVRELISRKDLKSLQLIFREPMFQYALLPYDEVAQIGIIVGLHFRDFDHEELEKELLKEPNFRDLVFKIFVDYNRLNGKYGRWIDFLWSSVSLDPETKTFISALYIWRNHLNQQPISSGMMNELPSLSDEQHPILYGRVWGLKMLYAKSRKEQNQLISVMENRLKSEVKNTGELLYIPVVQALVLNTDNHKKIIMQYQSIIHQISHWYHVSLVAIHKIYQVKLFLDEHQFSKAKSILENIPFGHIRHGYREFLDVYISFFRLKIAIGLNENSEELLREFEQNRALLNYPLFNDAYFETYFSEKL